MKILKALDVFRKGASVVDAVRAKNMSALVGTLAAALYAAAQLAKEFGYDIGLDAATAERIAVGVGAVAGLFVTYATSDKVGLPGLAPVVPPDPQPDQAAGNDVSGA